MVHFFSSCPAHHLRSMLGNLLQQLRQLESVISGLRNYRFYSASLLLVYDGEPALGGVPGVALKMIDFSNCSHKPSSSSSFGGADQGLLQGIANFIALVEDVACMSLP